MRLILFASFVILMLTVVIFSRRAYHSFLLLRSAYELGAPDVSSIRPWMTLRYIAETYRVPETALREHLGLPSAPPSFMDHPCAGVGTAPCGLPTRNAPLVGPFSHVLGSIQPGLGWLSGTKAAYRGRKNFRSARIGTGASHAPVPAGSVL